MLPNDNVGRTFIEMAHADMDVRPRFAKALNLTCPRLQELLASDHGLAMICKDWAFPVQYFPL